MENMNAIAKNSCYFERSVVTLKLHKEYLNAVAYNTSILLRIKYWTLWYIERYCTSTYTGVSNFQKTVRFSLAHPVYESYKLLKTFGCLADPVHVWLCCKCFKA